MRQQVVDLCVKFGALLVEDSPYALFAYSSEHMPPLFSDDGALESIFVGSFSKIIAPGLRTGFLMYSRAVAGSLVQSIDRFKAVSTFATSLVCQRVVEQVLRQSLKGYELPGEKQKTSYAAACELLCSVVGESPHVSFPYGAPSGGFFVTVELPFVPTDHDWLVSVEKFGVAWLPLNTYLSQGRMSAMVRLAFTSESMPGLEEGARRFCGFLQQKLTGIETN